ncbi:MAG: thiamine pyrophosphate-binding protein [Deltaproteobacteria bacterium]|nr:MAG: thiamine pyrophosphate-binding protein [Deltaproteobacteria bacterium]
MSHSTPQVNPRISSAGSAAGVVARFLKARGVDRIFALCGGHIMPLWMRADAEGIRIVDVRDERAAVHMAQAHAELTGGLLLWSARRPLVITGRGARGAAAELQRFLDRLGALYLDTGESRGLVPDDHPSVVAAARGTAMAEADVVVTVGRRLDFQLAFGSPAVFGSARFVRIADTGSELRDNRRGTVEVFATPSATLAAIVDAAGDRPASVDPEWAAGMRKRHLERVVKLRETMAKASAGSDGRMHPNRLLSALQAKLPPDAIVVADGGDFLSFVRVGLSSGAYLDPGPFGCIGVGVPFGIAASLAFPGRLVLVATGDGSFGFNAIELDTAVRHGAAAVFVVANNGAWQIEVHDQTSTYGRVAGTKLQFADHAAMARGFGMHAERVEQVDDLPGAIDRAFARRPALLDVIVTPEAVSADAKSGLAWDPDLQPLAAWDEAERAWRDQPSR